MQSQLSSASGGQFATSQQADAQAAVLEQPCHGAGCPEPVQRAQGTPPTRQLIAAVREAAGALLHPPAVPSPPPPPKHPTPIHAPPYNAGLVAGVAALINEADAVVRQRDIDTDIDATARRLAADAAALDLTTSDQEEALGEAGPGDLPLDPVCTSPAECGPHGACEAGRCRCVVLYTGVVCGHALVLSPTLLAPGLPRFVPAYEGELMLHAQTRHADIRVLRPGPALEWDLLADAAETAALNRILPPSDLVFKSKAYPTCAVVGSSGSLLLRRLGPAIDAHVLVLRLGATPSAGHEASLGSKTNLRMTDERDWAWRERPEDLALVRSASRATVTGLLANAASPAPAAIIALDPDFESWLADGLGFAADLELAGTLLALQTCRAVTLYGLAPQGPAQGVPEAYHEPCKPAVGTTGDPPGGAAARWAALQALARVGLVTWGEPCVEECMAAPAACDTCRAALGIVPKPVDAWCESARAAGRPPAEEAPGGGAAGGGRGNGTAVGNESAAAGSGQGAAAKTEHNSTAAATTTRR
ncbi:hypothetical protein ACKKBF_B12045 [Auxenochlorella protothecoides x Auxenochlorella symbiontica]